MKSLFMGILDFMEIQYHGGLRSRELGQGDFMELVNNGVLFIHSSINKLLMLPHIETQQAQIL